MRKQKWILTACLILAATPFASAADSNDLYPFPKVEEALPDKAREKKNADPFARALAKKTGTDEMVLADAFEKGFGRVELARLILISKKSGAPLETLIRERENGTRLAKIAKDQKQDNRLIRKEAAALIKETEKEAVRLRNEAASSPPIAGTVEVSTGTEKSYQGGASTEPARGKNNQ